MKYYLFIFLGFISCKTYTSSDVEFSNFPPRNEINIKKVKNFRYLGGIKNRDNKTLKDSLIYRSADLHDLKKSSFKHFEKLKISKVIDLRTLHEIDERPDHLPKNIIYENYRAFDDSKNELAGARKLAIKGKVDENFADARTHLFYEDYLTEHPEIVKKIIIDILDSNEPILYHCTAGKDRTGMITALVLKILNFEDNIIFEEYLLSNNQRESSIKKRLNLAYSLHFLFPKLDLGLVEKISWIEKDYLNASFLKIEQKYGSVENYISQALEINQAQRNAYIDKFLE